MQLKNKTWALHGEVPQLEKKLNTEEYNSFVASKENKDYVKNALTRCHSNFDRSRADPSMVLKVITFIISCFVLENRKETSEHCFL